MPKIEDAEDKVVRQVRRRQREQVVPPAQRISVNYHNECPYCSQVNTWEHLYSQVISTKPRESFKTLKWWGVDCEHCGEQFSVEVCIDFGIKKKE